MSAPTVDTWAQTRDLAATVLAVNRPAVPPARREVAARRIADDHHARATVITADLVDTYLVPASTVPSDPEADDAAAAYEDHYWRNS